MLFRRPKHAIGPIFCKDCLNLAPERFINDGLVLARVALVLMHDLAAINSILQHEIERAAGKRLLAISNTVRCIPRLTDNT